MTLFTFETPLVTVAQWVLLKNKVSSLFLKNNMLSLVIEPHWSVVAYRLLEGLLSYTTNMPPEREASPNLQHYNLAIENKGLGRRQDILSWCPVGSELVVGVLEKLPCLSD